MSNKNSSTRSQLTSASGITNRNANISSKIAEDRDRRNRNRTLKLCDFSWTWNIDEVDQSAFAPPTFSSSVFSSPDDDLKWHFGTSKESEYECEATSITLHVNHENGFFKKYNAISGKVKLSLMRIDGRNIVTKEQKFEIQNTGNTLPSIDIPDFIDHTKHWIPNNQLRFVCNIAYKTTEEKIQENFPLSLSEDFENLLTDKQFGDLIVKVQDKEYPVYKGILAARSAYFRAMFRENNDMIENTTNVVDLSKSKIRPDVFEEILRFIYSGKVKNLETLAYELLPAADMYQLKELMEICEETLFQQFSKGNVIKILILAHEYNADWLKTEALQFVKLHSRYADLKDTKIWDVLTSYRDLMKDLLAVFLDK